MSAAPSRSCLGGIERNRVILNGEFATKIFVKIDLFCSGAPAPNLRPRNGEFKVGTCGSLFRVLVACEPPACNAVAERSEGISGFYSLTAPSPNTSTGVLLSSALCLLSLL